MVPPPLDAVIHHATQHFDDMPDAKRLLNAGHGRENFSGNQRGPRQRHHFPQTHIARTASRFWIGIELLSKVLHQGSMAAANRAGVGLHRGQMMMAT